jgi:arginyl-tRNA synthetase
MESIAKSIQTVAQKLFGESPDVVLTRPDEQFGDYATNVALQLGQKLGKKPRDIADQIVAALENESILKKEVAGPGFINLTLTDAALLTQLRKQPVKTLEGRVIVLEYSDPNPFKVLHAGHLYQGTIGDAIANLLSLAGADLHCVNFGGDVGLHVGKTMWAVMKALDGENPGKLADIPDAERSEWMAAAYVKGTAAYEDDETAKQEIIVLNKRVYDLHTNNDHASPFAQIYWTCRTWSYDYFNAFYKRVGSHFEKYYPESETAPIGVATVMEQLANGVYEKSDGAIIFDGEKYGLHTRVFINSNNLPTYETKDVGLSMAKWRDYHFDSTIIITGNDIVEYMKVVLKSIEQFEPELVKRTHHLTHGNVKLAGGVKMSSRKGNFLRATDVLDIVSSINREATGKDDQNVVLGIFDPKESVSLEGNSGPYLQYAHARACSILKKSETSNTKQSEIQSFEPGERTLARKLGMYQETVELATKELMPHHICTYLYELAQTFNRFYEQNRVIGDIREGERLALVTNYVSTLKNGLNLLGIHAPEQM